MPLLLRLGGSHALKKHVGIFGWGVGLKDVTRGTGKGYQQSMAYSSPRSWKDDEEISSKQANGNLEERLQDGRNPEVQDG